MGWIFSLGRPLPLGRPKLFPGILQLCDFPQLFDLPQCSLMLVSFSSGLA